MSMLDIHDMYASAETYARVVATADDVDLLATWCGLTPLEMARIYYREDHLRLLVEAGATITEYSMMIGDDSMMFLDLGADVFNDASVFFNKQAEQRRCVFLVALCIDGLPRGLGWRVVEWMLKV